MTSEWKFLISQRTHSINKPLQHYPVLPHLLIILRDVVAAQHVKEQELLFSR